MDAWQWVGIAFAAAFLARMISWGGSDARESTLRRIERKLDMLLESQRLKPDASTPDEEIRFLAKTQKIQAIKMYRQRHPEVGLKEAKEIIDALERT